MDERFWEGARFMAVHIPEMVISFLGIVLSVANWRKHPRPALLSFLGFALMLGSTIAMSGFIFWYFLADPKWDGEIAWLGSFGIRSLLNAGGYPLLIFAIYASRKPKAPVPPMAFADVSK
jgi:hypothetical protein